MIGSVVRTKKIGSSLHLELPILFIRKAERLLNLTSLNLVNHSLSCEDINLNAAVLLTAFSGCIVGNWLVE